MTVGLSPKAILAALFPSIATLLGVLLEWALSGKLDALELHTAIAGLATAALSFVGAWLGVPGDVAINVGEPSDAANAEAFAQHLDS